MFKVIGSIAVIASMGFIGTGRYEKIKERKHVLETVRDGTQKITDNLRCMCMPLYECFLKGGVFYNRAASYMKMGLLPCEAVKKAAKDFSFSKEDYSCVCRFSEGLVAADCEGQIRNAQHFIGELEKSIAKTEKELDTKGKLFIKGSFLMAAAIVLILL